MKGRQFLKVALVPREDGTIKVFLFAQKNGVITTNTTFILPGKFCLAQELEDLLREGREDLPF